MLYVVASPDLMTAAATNLAEIGSAISTANGAAALPTVEVVAAAADEVSTQIAALFGAHARSYQTLSTQAAAFHSRFVQALTTAAASYASVEAANASPLQVALDVINAPAQTLLGRPLIGNGTLPTYSPVAGQRTSITSEVDGLVHLPPMKSLSYSVALSDICAAPPHRCARHRRRRSWRHPTQAERETRTCSIIRV